MNFAFKIKMILIQTFDTDMNFAFKIKMILIQTFDTDMNRNIYQIY